MLCNFTRNSRSLILHPKKFVSVTKRVTTTRFLAGLRSPKIKKHREVPVLQGLFMVEPRGIEPLTSSLPAMRSLAVLFKTSECRLN